MPSARRCLSAAELRPEDAAWLGNCWELSAARGRSSDAFGKHPRSGCGCGDLRGSIGRGQAVNRVLPALFGFSAAGALGRSLDLIAPEHLRAAHWRGFDDAMASGVQKLQGRPTLTRALHKSGRKVYVGMTLLSLRSTASRMERSPWRATSRSGSHSRRSDKPKPPARDDGDPAWLVWPVLDRDQGVRQKNSV